MTGTPPWPPNEPCWPITIWKKWACPSPRTEARAAKRWPVREVRSTLRGRWGEEGSGEKPPFMYAFIQLIVIVPDTALNTENDTVLNEPLSSKSSWSQNKRFPQSMLIY